MTDLHLRHGPAVDPDDQRRATAAALAAADAAGLVDVAIARTDSPIGTLTLAATPAGLVRIGFESERDTIAAALAARISPRVVELPARLDDARRQLDQYFAGQRHHFDLPVDLRLSTGFRRRVLEALLAKVGFGHTASYADLAILAGSPAAHRAVGTAMATNPIPIVIPCHRVLRTGGGIGGYGGGLDVKRLLLTLEGSLLA
jgi:methylated-DNA-[protein]-cysteine S-methyltransferase